MNMPEKKEINMNEEKLKRLADKLSRHFWDRPCRIPVIWNGRLKRSMGRFLFQAEGEQRKPLRIELSKHAAAFINREIFVAVLLHELCHYHLFIAGKPFADHHPLFEKELRRVGAISTNQVQIPQKGYELFCQKCQRTLGLRKRINTQRYRSACCRAPILKKEKWIGRFHYDGQILKKSKVQFKDQ